MQHCFDLASKALGQTGTNPIVGAVIVYDGRIIGKGFHEKQGGPHAEVNAVQSVKPSERKFLKRSHLYVSLEPCNHYGKTPPCTALILENKIPELSISVKDPNPDVAGNGAEFLRAQGVKVHEGILEEKGNMLIRPFLISSKQKRPYIIIKTAVSKDGYIGKKGERIQLSGPATNRLVHLWRAQVSGIMVGTETAITDNPKLTVREVSGKNPMRIVPDWNERIPKGHFLLNDNIPAIIFSGKNHYNAFKSNNKEVIYAENEDKNLKYFLNKLFEKGIGILLVEGGASLISSFIKEDLWDEARIINTPVEMGHGIDFPEIIGKQIDLFQSGDDQIRIIWNVLNT
jgi:diaminohydroxyphosphoribosylaminopyrimidine deaminase/5-amino-6-(5-phosphoribosylamino)uracil reductase